MVTAARRLLVWAVQHDRTLLRIAGQLVAFDQFGRCLEGDTGGRVEAAHQALGKDALQGGGEQVTFDAHVQQAGDAGGGAVGVQGRQYQVPGQR
ncbi:hypothetical protein D3C73_1438300 [compost metagenome]